MRSGCARGFADGNGRATPTNRHCNPTAYGFAFADDGGGGNGRCHCHKHTKATATQPHS
ncbi:MAG: hypothetical protein KBE23_22830 [Chloroflexi bacterium]|nr:hypothetical protein [Chloroflexota bacterium]MBP7045605.1 hypothetical protein [Chloroflexota bacterium]